MKEWIIRYTEYLTALTPIRRGVEGSIEDAMDILMDFRRIEICRGGEHIATVTVKGQYRQGTAQVSLFRYGQAENVGEIIAEIERFRTCAREGIVGWRKQGARQMLRRMGLLVEEGVVLAPLPNDRPAAPGQSVWADDLLL